MDWIQQWQSKLNKQNGVAPLVQTGGSRHTGLAALPHRNIHSSRDAPLKRVTGIKNEICSATKQMMEYEKPQKIRRIILSR